jgi:hypothetical protein
LVDQGEQQIASLEAKDGPAFQEVRDVCADLNRDTAQPGVVHSPQPAKPAEGGRSVTAAAAQSGRHRDPLLEIDRDVARRTAAAGRLP